MQNYWFHSECEHSAQLLCTSMQGHKSIVQIWPWKDDRKLNVYSEAKMGTCSADFFIRKEQIVKM